MRGIRTIDSAGVPGHLLADYAAIPIAFSVTSRMSAKAHGEGAFVLTEEPVEPGFIKDYDAIGERPHDWAGRFDTSRWRMWLARVDGVAAGGATVAFGDAGLDMLEGRSDLAVLWDIRVAPPFRGRGIGRALFHEVEGWAGAQGCTEVKVETQNINVSACRFYAALGCELRIVRAEAYPSCPGEVQFLWYKPLGHAAACDFYVITGASGAGKSTLVAALSELGYSTVQEAALTILREQQACKGHILPWVNRAAFFEEVLARNVSNHQAARTRRAPVFFDRGIPECLAWLQLSGQTLEARHLAAVAQYRYAPTVFVAEPWPEIYVQNTERQARFERAARSYEPAVAAYAEAGYNLCLLPKASVHERVAFILERVETGGQPFHRAK
jgi:predicted ATPase/GNAT superfamily N-acetyltransferase